tara:strand:+ start:1659 stop:2633 length:975 start_codon:yes stop_codon:yes gene_type:complete
MDILTLGKMNQMAKNTNSALDLMANHVYETLQDITGVQATAETTIDASVADGLANIQTLIDTGVGGDPQKDFYIYNTNHWSVTNGGCCLSWTVPTGAQIIKFEILSGGGPGGSSGWDYDIGHGGAGGNYNVKTICKDAGEFVSTAGTESVFMLCAGGTSMCSCCGNCNRNCRHGCTSYVTGPGLSNFCAIGGHGGSTSWDKQSNCYNCHIGNQQCDLGSYNGGWVSHNCNEASHGGDMCFRGISGSHYQQYNCCADSSSFSGGPAGPFSVSGTAVNKHWCTGNMACCSAHSAFPGGGGAGHQSGSGSTCWGGFGAGGLVKVTYQ